MIPIRRTVNGYEGFYEVDRKGNVYSLDRFDGRMNRRGKKLKEDLNSVNYSRVTLSKSGKTKRVFVHRLVYESYYGEIPEGLQIHHIDEDKQNNSIKNLLAVTQRQNNHFSREALGYKLTQKDVDHIRSTGMTTREVSDRYDVSLRHALRVIKNERWIS